MTTLSHLYLVIRQTVNTKINSRFEIKLHNFLFEIVHTVLDCTVGSMKSGVEIGRKAAVCLRSVISNPEQFFFSVSWVDHQKVRRIVAKSFERSISMNGGPLHACYFRRVYCQSIELIWGKERTFFNQI